MTGGTGQEPCQRRKTIFPETLQGSFSASDGVCRLACGAVLRVLAEGAGTGGLGDRVIFSRTNIFFSVTTAKQ